MSRFERCGHTFSAWNLMLGKILTGLSAWVTLSFMRFPGDLTPPMDTYLHASRREVNQNPVTNSGLKQGLVVLAAQAYQYGDEASYSRLRLRPFALVIVVAPLHNATCL